MKYSEAKPGRVFVLRLEDGDILHESIEAFAIEHEIMAASLIALGGGCRAGAGAQPDNRPYGADIGKRP